MHFVTYFLAGLVASSLLDYRWAFEQPVIRDYMVAFASTAVFLGPALQVVRGMIFGLVLLPFRHSIATRLGWLWLWALVIGIGILSAGESKAEALPPGPAAARVSGSRKTFCETGRTDPRGASSGHRVIARRIRGSTGWSALIPQTLKEKCHPKTPRTVTDLLRQKRHRNPETLHLASQESAVGREKQKTPANRGF